MKPSAVEARRIEDLSVTCDAVLTIGVLDGVHVGHQHLLKTLVRRAKEIDGCSSVITFDPHPLAVVAPDTELCYLTTLEDRLRLIEEQGVDIVAVLHFTPEVSRMSPEEFIGFLLSHIKMVELWVGPDFALGCRRAGTVPALAEIGKNKGFSVHTIPPVKVGGKMVSSTEIRGLMAQGKVKEAAKLLGRKPFLVAKVVNGFGRGREIGVPTANLEVNPKLIIPADGVYAVYVYFDNERRQGALSIGSRPTFDDGAVRSIEVHILDFTGELRGKTLKVEFVERLRDEMHFPGVDALVAQIHADVQSARQILA
ncbi:MAG: bifunctional riboflavin kinase/FAD synthetase [Chloroflexi bacterium]|nr:bifunctional riboflavin kinase/FAD synthetase [Chloroflexota bacterium]